MTIQNTVISGNTVQTQGTNQASGTGAEGGGVYDCGGLVTLQNSTIRSEIEEKGRFTS